MRLEHEIHAYERGANLRSKHAWGARYEGTFACGEETQEYAPGACGARTMWGMRVVYEVCVWSTCLIDSFSETKTLNELRFNPDTVVLFKRLKRAVEAELLHSKSRNNAILSVGNL